MNYFYRPIFRTCAPICFCIRIFHEFFLANVTEKSVKTPFFCANILQTFAGGDDGLIEFLRKQAIKLVGSIYINFDGKEKKILQSTEISFLIAANFFQKTFVTLQVLEFFQVLSKNTGIKDHLLNFIFLLIYLNSIILLTRYCKN